MIQSEREKEARAASHTERTAATPWPHELQSCSRGRAQSTRGTDPDRLAGLQVEGRSRTRSNGASKRGGSL